MSLFSGYSTATVQSAVCLANAAYVGEPLPFGWTALTNVQLGAYGVDAGDFTGNYYDGAEILGWGAAQALVAQNGSQLAISFRGTDEGAWDYINYPDLFVANNYVNAFNDLLDAVQLYAEANHIPSSNIIITGHSLGAGGANNLRNVSSSSPYSFYENANYIAFATPFVSNRADILNFGFENDPIFQVDSGDHASRTDNLVFFDDAFASNDWPGAVFTIVQEEDRTAHSRYDYIDAVNALARSSVLNETNRDSVIIFDATDHDVKDKNTSSSLGGIFGYHITDHASQGAIFIGQDNHDDVHRDGPANDIFDMFGGDDTVYLSHGDDRVLGGAGNDTAILQTESRADVDLSENGNTTTITHATEGTKTLTDVETILYYGLSDVTDNALLPHGANTLYRNDDGSSSAVSLSSIFEDGINYNGTTYNSLYVNTNGNVTFAYPLSQYTPSQIGNGNLSIIAPYWADVDTRLPDEGTNGNVYWDFNTDRDSFVVTWEDVGYYQRHSDLTNTFQLELVDQGGGNFEAIFRYADINWTTGDASSGDNGLGGYVARAGLSATSAEGDPFELPGSGQQGSALAWDTTRGNTGVAGVWQFQVFDGDTQGLGGESADNYQGTDGDDYYFGNGGNDELYGHDGSDNLYGGPGDDTIVGGAGDDFVYGDEGNDHIVAGEGEGNDSYDGGTGTDIITFTSTSRGVFVHLAGYVASGPEIGVDTLTAIENVVGGSGADTIYGDGLGNYLNGVAGSDRLYGLGGNDQLYGENGDDYLYGGPGADLLNGGNNNDRLYGHEGNDRLYGQNGNDWLYGHAGNDYLAGGSGADYLYGGTENDQLLGEDGNDRLFGESRNDKLFGGNGSDWLTGGPGSDLLNGGAGSDYFDYNSIGEIGNSPAARDTIADFRHGVDHIDLRTIDASSALAGNNAFVWRGSGNFTTSKSGELRYVKYNNAGTANDYTMIYGDTDADKAAEFQIKLNGLITPTRGDFLL